jgi:hypothetical protein
MVILRDYNSNGGIGELRISTTPINLIELK